MGTQTAPTTPRATRGRATHQQRALNAFRRIIRGLRVAAAETQADAGVSAAQLFVLTQLRDASAESLSELGERTMTDRSSVAAVVERLTERGLVVSTPSPADRRRTMIRITPNGRAVLRRAPEPPGAQLAAALATLSARDLTALVTAIEQLVAHMGLAQSPAEMLFADDDRVVPRAGRAPRRPR